MASKNKTSALSDSIPRTHEGAIAKRISAIQELRRSVLACLLWEESFYEDGESIAERIKKLVRECDPVEVSILAIQARSEFKLRHVPLLLVRELAHHHNVRDVLSQVIQRPDELSEFLTLYFDGNSRNRKERMPIAASVKRGLADAFKKFDAYQLAKYNRDTPIKLRDVMFLCHPKPDNDEQAAIWKQLASGTLPTPDTWEVELSASTNKTDSWLRLLRDRKLGALALLRNLRNMLEAKIPEDEIRAALAACNPARVLPFRFITAARYAPQLELELENLMFQCLHGHDKLPGKTVLVVDHSGSMISPLSAKSDMTRFDAACALAMLLRETCEQVEVVAYSAPADGPTKNAYRGFRIGSGGVVIPPRHDMRELVQMHGVTYDIGMDRPHLAIVPPRRGFALRDAIEQSVSWCGTNTDDAIGFANERGYDRIIVLTDEQSHQTIRGPLPDTAAYFVNVATEKNGIGYGKWQHIDGFSEAIIDYIRQCESLSSLPALSLESLAS